MGTARWWIWLDCYSSIFFVNGRRQAKSQTRKIIGLNVNANGGDTYDNNINIAVSQEERI